MNMDKIGSVMLAIVSVAGISLFALHPESAQVISALGNAFSNSIKAATGRG